MKTKLFSILATLVLVTNSVFATELDDLKDKYNKAAAQAMKPINLVYQTELKRLVAKSGLDETEKARIEIELKKMEEALGTSVKLTPQDFRRFVEGKDWKTPTGTTFHFNQNGKGYREFGKDKTTFTWKFVAENVVETTGENVQGGTVTNWYFKFDSSNKGFYGDSLQRMDRPLDRQ